MDDTLDVKVNAAQEVVRAAIAKHGSGLYVAYSGGKDSRALLKLVRSVNAHALVIHNRHDGEEVEDDFGLLCIKAPKAENVPAFMELVELKAQIDATRRAEDKNVWFDGVDIHRSGMPGPNTTNGVFGLEVYFPLLEWSDSDVLDYLERQL